MSVRLVFYSISSCQRTHVLLMLFPHSIPSYRSSLSIQLEQSVPRASRSPASHLPSQKLNLFFLFSEVKRPLYPLFTRFFVLLIWMARLETHPFYLPSLTPMLLLVYKNCFFLARPAPRSPPHKGRKAGLFCVSHQTGVLKHMLQFGMLFSL